MILSLTVSSVGMTSYAAEPTEIGAAAVEGGAESPSGAPESSVEVGSSGETGSSVEEGFTGETGSSVEEGFTGETGSSVEEGFTGETGAPDGVDDSGSASSDEDGCADDGEGSGGDAPDKEALETDPLKNALKDAGDVSEQKPFEYSKDIAGYTIDLKAEPGVLPEDVETHIKAVSRTDDGESIRDIVEKEIDEGKKILSMITFDISFTSNGEDIEPEEGKVSVSIKLSSSMKKNIEEAEQTYDEVNLEIFHIDEDKAEIVESDLTEEKDLEFEAEKFSPYTVVLYANQITTATLKTIFNGTVSTVPNNKPLVLIFFSSVYNTEIFEMLCRAPLTSDIDFIAGEMHEKSKEDVIQFYNTYTSDRIVYCYDAYAAARSYHQQLGGGSGLGWPFVIYINEDGDIIDYTHENLDILAKIESVFGISPLDEPFHVVFNANGGTGEMDTQDCYIGHDFYDNKANAVTFTRKGYKFKEWNTKADGTGDSYPDRTELTDLCSTKGATVNLYAIWSKVKYKITYSLDGGTNSADNPATYYVNTATFNLAAPTKKGAAFEGWYSDSALTKKVTQVKKGTTGNKTFYAKWTPYKYSIQFVGNGSDSGSVAKMTDCEYGTTYTLTANAFKKTDYTFAGWNTKADGSGTSYANKAQVRNLSAKDGATVKLYAQWAITDYAITYNLNGGTNNSANPATYNKQSGLITLAAPTRKGYTFGGWYSDSALKTASSEIPAGSTGKKTFYAKWTAIRYTVQFDGNGATSGVLDRTISCVYDETYPLLETPFARKGFTFAGWNTKADGTGTGVTDMGEFVNLSSKNKATVTLYAQWTPNTYTIKFNGNGSTSGTMAAQKNCAYGSSIMLASNSFEKTGYTFSLWNTKADGTGKQYADRAKVKNLTATDGGTVTLYATWTKTPYTITYNLKGGDNCVDNPTTYYVTTKTIVLKDAVRDGFTFGGWYSDSKYTTQVTQIAKGSTGNKTLYAKWTAHKYTVKFNGNGSTSGSVAALKDCKCGGTYTLPANAFKKTGYKFMGWNTKKDGTGTQLTDSCLIKDLTLSDGATKTLYAQWAVIKYTVKFSGNGSDPGSMSAMSGLTGGTSYTLKKNVFAKTGYSFNGWNTKADGSGTSYKDQASVKDLSTKDGGSVTLYAQWKLSSYTITYNLNGGANNSANPASYKMTTDTISLKNPTRKGYSFKGWFAESGFKTKVTQIEQGSTGNRTLYAKWAAISYYIEYDNNDPGNIQNIAPLAAVKYDKTVVLDENSFTRKGYTFVSWNTKADGSGTSYEDQASVKNLTTKNGETVILYAQWQPIQYKIVFKGNGSTSGKMATMTCIYGKSYKLRANGFTKDSYSFESWNTKADGTGKVYSDQASVKNLTTKDGATVTLYARWIKKAGLYKLISLGVESRSEEDICNFVRSHSISGDTSGYGVAPSLQEPYSAGSYSDEALANGLNYLNTIRYVAGLDANVKLNSKLNGWASKATLLNYLNGKISSAPKRPSELAASKYDSLYNDGYIGAENSIMTNRSSNGTVSSLYGFMFDGNTDDRLSLEHRRWLLYPELKEVGFGRTDNYVAVCCKHGYSGSTGKIVAWPAQNTPTELVQENTPWSVSVGRHLNIDNIEVYVHCDANGWEVTLNSTTQNGFLAVNNNAYGEQACIIFSPGSGYFINDGVTYHVTIKFNDTREQLEYDVNFFDDTNEASWAHG